MFDLNKVQRHLDTYKNMYEDNILEKMSGNKSRVCKVIYHNEHTHIAVNLTEPELAGFSGNMYFRYNSGQREIYKFIDDRGVGLYGVGEDGNKAYFSRGCSMAVLASTDSTINAMAIPVNFLKKYEAKKRDVDMLNVSYSQDVLKILKIVILPHSLLYRAEAYVDAYIRPKHHLIQPFLYADFIQCYMFGAEFGKKRN